MNPITKFLLRNPRINRQISSYPIVGKMSKPFVAGESLEEISNLLEKYNREGFGVTLYPIQGTSRDYQEAIGYLARLDLKRSVSLRTPLNGIDEVVKSAKEQRITLELDMRRANTITDTIGIYKEIEDEHPDTIICLQSNLHRTSKDIENVKQVRLVKGAFDGDYTSDTTIKENYLSLAKKSVQKNKKTLLATHDRELISQFCNFVEREDISKEKFGFEMYHRVDVSLQAGLRDKGHNVWKYVVYGANWLPHVVNRILERKENALLALQGILGGEK